jgi:hypothetical protein
MEEELTVSTVEASIETKELQRWLYWLGGSLLGACLFLGLALAGYGAWLMAPAIIIGPGVGGIALVWLAITSDTNALPAAPSAVPALPEPLTLAEAAA